MKRYPRRFGATIIKLFEISSIGPTKGRRIDRDYFTVSWLEINQKAPKRAGRQLYQRIFAYARYSSRTGGGNTFSGKGLIGRLSEISRSIFGFNFVVIGGGRRKTRKDLGMGSG